MEIAKHTHATVIVSSEWRNLGAVNLLIGVPDNPDTGEDGSSVLDAEILDAIDDRGLWIELNAGQKEWPGSFSAETNGPLEICTCDRAAA
jgi:hypothetical protein